MEIRKSTGTELHEEFYSIFAVKRKRKKENMRARPGIYITMHDTRFRHVNQICYQILDNLIIQA